MNMIGYLRPADVNEPDPSQGVRQETGVKDGAVQLSASYMRLAAYTASGCLAIFRPGTDRRSFGVILTQRFLGAVSPLSYVTLFPLVLLPVYLVFRRTQIE